MGWGYRKKFCVRVCNLGGWQKRTLRAQVTQDQKECIRVAGLCSIENITLVISSADALEEAGLNFEDNARICLSSLYE